jgi:hypothetical protein
LPDGAFLVDTASWKADKGKKDEGAANSTATAEKVANDAFDSLENFQAFLTSQMRFKIMLFQE